MVIESNIARLTSILSSLDERLNPKEDLQWFYHWSVRQDISADSNQPPQHTIDQIPLEWETVSASKHFATVPPRNLHTTSVSFYPAIVNSAPLDIGRNVAGGQLILIILY